MNKKEMGIWVFFEVLGLAVLTLGVSAVIIAGLGSGALDTVTHAIAKLIPQLSMGTWNFIINLLIAFILFLITKERKILFTIIPVLLMSLFIDGWNFMFGKIFNFTLIDASGLSNNLMKDGQTFNAVWVSVAGLITMAIGVAILIHFKSILTPYDETSVQLTKITKRYFLSKMILDGTFMALGMLLGYFAGNAFEQVGVFSLAILFGLGPMIDLFLKLFKKGRKEYENEQVY